MMKMLERWKKRKATRAGMTKNAVCRPSVRNALKVPILVIAYALINDSDLLPKDT
jgi:hypothetical protein